VLESISTLLYTHMKNIQIGGSTRLVCQFEGKVVIDSELNSKSDSGILNLIGSPP
jgi:hypothetical protein